MLLFSNILFFVLSLNFCGTNGSFGNSIMFSIISKKLSTIFYLRDAIDLKQNHLNSRHLRSELNLILNL